MRKTKKLLLSISMMFCVTCCLMNLIIYIQAEDSVHIGIDNIQCNTQSQICVNISLDNNPGIWGIDIKVNYPSDILQLKSIRNGNVFSVEELTEPNIEKNPVILSFENSGLNNTNNEGILATIVFDVSENAKSGTYKIELSCSDGDIIDSDANEIPFILENGTITVKADDRWHNPFIDVTDTDTFYHAVRFVYENKLFIGVSDTEFAPHLTMTRAMFVTVLGRLAKIDQTKYTKTDFKDVKNGEWYSAYVEWAEETGIVNGYGNGEFGINDKITVEQAATIIARYARYTGIDTHHVNLAKYKDITDVSKWAMNDLAWIVESGIYAGTDGRLFPKEYAERALVATMMYKFIAITEK